MEDQKVAPLGEGAGEPVAVWPCADCGRPVPQPVRGARTVRYCPDGDGVCEAAARGRRDRGRGSPGLTGQVAWTWEMVERLEGAADRLAASLAAELSVAGVERRVAGAQADAAQHVAIAQQERDASQRQAEAAWREAASARERAETAERDAAAARAELVTLHARLSESETLMEGRRIEATAARRAAEDLRAAVRDAEAKRGQAVADRDQVQARLHELEQHDWKLSRTVEEQRAALAALTAERDAARAEADRARRRVDALTGLTGPVTADGRPVNGMRPIVDEEPPTGLHSLNDGARNETRRDLRVTGGRANGEPPKGVRLPHAG